MGGCAPLAASRHPPWGRGPSAPRPWRLPPPRGAAAPRPGGPRWPSSPLSPAGFGGHGPRAGCGAAPRAQTLCGLRAWSGGRSSLAAAFGGSPRPFCALRVLPPRGPCPWARPLRRGAPARCAPPSARPPRSLARPLCAAARLRGLSLAPAGSRVVLRSAAGSPVGVALAPLRAPRAPARGPAGPPGPSALRASGGPLLASLVGARAPAPGGLRGPSGRLLGPPAPRGFGCAPAPARAC